MKILLTTILTALMLGACVAPSEVTLSAGRSEPIYHERSYVDPIEPTIVLDRDFRHRPDWHRRHPGLYHDRHNH